MMVQYYRVDTKVATSPGEYPVDIAEVKNSLRITHSAEDSYIEILIHSMTEIVQEYLGRKLLTHTIEGYSDAVSRKTPWWDGTVELPFAAVFGGPREIELPWAPLQSVTSVSVFSQEDVETTLSQDLYRVDNKDNNRGRVVMKSTSSWPSINLRNTGAIKIVYKSGYADTQTAFKAAAPGIHLAVLHAVGQAYTNRGDCEKAMKIATPMLKMYRLYRGL